MSEQTTVRPFQVGDRVRITDNNIRRLHPDAQYVFEGVVSKIDPAADPDSEYTYGPYLWADVEPYTSPVAGHVFDRVFCPMTDDLTTGSDNDTFGRAVELLEPAPTDPSGGAVTSTPAPSDDTTPSLVELDRREAEQRVLRTALAWHACSPDADDVDDLRDAFWAMKDAIADYAKAVSS